ncbi:hypothetical protein SAMN04488029_2785 [Reichenbachiella faecimaris]|uniref:Uncharacterized protein n=1 Tax=Reichenbachiella faecimaris TaxID=692418 RepID=A0A1W2GHU8_REIFA|nr:hypothetical protein [Reichenbachiella faecimaris]SMD36230.1 hypothetical protein SAMN04488029_2785 [Reichenbachiella faecimaris]
MIIWSGRGILTPLILVTSVVLFISISSEEIGVYTFPISILLAGVANWILGKKWNSASGRIVVDEATGERIELKSNHTLFWIKMEYWGVLFGIIGLGQLLRLIF